MNQMLILTNTISSIKNYYCQNSKFAYCKLNRFNKQVLLSLYKEGLIYGSKEEFNKLKIGLKYFKDKPLINEISLIYKPSLKRSYNFSELRRYYWKYDIFFVSTTKGILSSNDLIKLYTKNNKIGGQLLFGIQLSRY